MSLQIGNYLISRLGAGTRRFEIIVQHRVNDGGVAAGLACDNIDHSPSLGVKKCLVCDEAGHDWFFFNLVNYVDLYYINLYIKVNCLSQALLFLPPQHL